jgi:hypothetical protein
VAARFSFMARGDALNIEIKFLGNLPCFALIVIFSIFLFFPSRAGAAATGGSHIAVKSIADTAAQLCNIIDGSDSAARIKVSRNRLHHVLERHAFDGYEADGESIFYPVDDIAGLIQKAALARAELQRNGNCQRIIDAGRAIGVDRATNKATSIYTVITDTSGNLVTAFPGRP